MNDGLTSWSVRSLRGGPPDGAVVELVDHTGRRLMLVGRTEGERLAAEHNQDVERARNAIADARAHGTGERVTVTQDDDPARVAAVRADTDWRELDSPAARMWGPGAERAAARRARWRAAGKRIAAALTRLACLLRRDGSR